MRNWSIGFLKLIFLKNLFQKMWNICCKKVFVSTVTNNAHTLHVHTVNLAINKLSMKSHQDRRKKR